MDRIDKFLDRLSAKEEQAIEKTIARIYARRFEGLDCKKLKGVGEFYRVRVGTIRIIFQMNKREVRVVSASRRNDKTYRDI